MTVSICHHHAGPEIAWVAIGIGRKKLRKYGVITSVNWRGMEVPVVLSLTGFIQKCLRLKTLHARPKSCDFVALLTVRQRSWGQY